MRVLAILSLVSAFVFCSVTHAFAQASPAQKTSTDSSSEPSVFSYAFRGVLAGGLVGLGAGYVVERDGGRDWDGTMWKHIGIWSASGAGAGLVLGLSLAGVDKSDGGSGGGYVLASDLAGGALIGGVMGAVFSGFYASAVEKDERAAFGAALGILTGAGVGLIVGFLQAPHAGERQGRYARRLAPAFSADRDSRGRMSWVAGASGTF